MNRAISKAVVLVSVLILICLVQAQSADAGEWYIGGGFQTQTFGADLEDGRWFNLDQAIGLNVDAGYKITQRIAVETIIGLSGHRESDSGTNTAYTWFEVGPKYFFTMDQKNLYYATAGLGSYAIDIDQTDHDGIGIFVGGGLETFIGDRYFVDMYLRGSNWRDDSTELDVGAWSVGANVNYLFN